MTNNTQQNMMERQPDISVITVNYNGWEDTCEFINSWMSVVTSVSYELIIVDNASGNDEGKRLQRRYPGATVIRNKENSGFAGANNIGIKAAKGRYIFFLNNDVVITQDTIRPLLHGLLSSDKTAGVSPLIRNYEAPHAIQFAGYTPLSPITLRNKAIGEGDTAKEQYLPGRTPYLHGAAMLIKRSVIDKIGPMCEDYFLYYEETDWCTRMTDAGYELRYDPVCEVLHKASQSTGANSPLKAYYMSRNRLLYAYRNRRGFAFYPALAYQLMVVLPKTVIVSLLEGQADIAQAHLKGVKSFYNYTKRRKR